MRHGFYIGLLFIALASSCNGGQGGDNPYTYNVEKIPDWKEGYLDIHHISTGRGNCSFMIMPDGTTMLVDIGDVGSTSFQEICPAKPNSTKTPAGWVALYIEHFSKPAGNDGNLDYAFLTHFHDDHMGGEVSTAITKPGSNYKLSGITELANLLTIDLIVDRGYPLYDYYPSSSLMAQHNSKTLPNYLRYIKERDAAGGKTEMFAVGKSDQFVMKHHPETYPDFEIRNIFGNGMVWTGTGENTKVVVSSDDFGGENSASCGIALKYGKFNYYTGGDIQGEDNTGGACNMESEVSKIMEPQEVVVCNHHAFSDAMHNDFIKAASPKAYIIPVWGIYQPHKNALIRMLDTGLYSGERMVFATARLENNDKSLGDNADKIITPGHVVVRVYEGGDEYQIFVLSDETQAYNVIYKTDILKAE